jgi:murein DD-endopeptidase MepM/ murein hydrolase activator NlpD
MTGRRMMKKAAAALLCLLAALAPCRAAVQPELGAAFAPAAEAGQDGEDAGESAKKYIKWMKFDVPCAALGKALKLDIAAHAKGQPGSGMNWIKTLAYLAAKYGGIWSRYRAADMDKLAAALKSGKSIDELAAGMKYYAYYSTAYDAVLAGLAGEKETGAPQPGGGEGYGLTAFSPIAGGWGYSHYRDFGAARSFGYSRPHLGNDLLGSVGTPVIAVEGGTVEALGWNRYGGWRVGIRSIDGRRYYYYAHLRRGHPYAAGLAQGAKVRAGDVIGYLGMTGYSAVPDVDNMTRPHLHFGLQIIFDESQKEGSGEIWVDVYDIVELLRQNRSAVVRDGRDYRRAGGPTAPDGGGPGA